MKAIDKNIYNNLAKITKIDFNILEKFSIEQLFYLILKININGNKLYTLMFRLKYKKYSKEELTSHIYKKLKIEKDIIDINDFTLQQIIIFFKNFERFKCSSPNPTGALIGAGVI